MDTNDVARRPDLVVVPKPEAALWSFGADPGYPEADGRYVLNVFLARHMLGRLKGCGDLSEHDREILKTLRDFNSRQRAFETLCHRLMSEARATASSVEKRPARREPMPRAPRSRRTRTPSSSRAPDEPRERRPAPAGLYALTCESCGERFSSTRPHTRTCSGACRQKLHVRARAIDAGLLRLGDLAWTLVRRGEISPDDALALVIWPSPRIMAALDVREGVAA